MERKVTSSIAENAREYGELSNDNPLKWKPQTLRKTKPPPSNPPSDPQDHTNNNSNNNTNTNTNTNTNNNGNNKDSNNNNVTEEGGYTTPQGIGAGDLLQSSRIEDIVELPHDDGPSPNQAPGEGGEEEEEEFSLPTSLSSQDDGGHRSPSTDIDLPDDEGGVKQAIGLLLDAEMSENEYRRCEEGNEMISMPESLSSQDGGGHLAPSMPKSLSSQDGGGHLAPYPSMANVKGSVKQILTWQKTNLSENRGLFSMPKSLSSRVDGILPHPNIGINDVIPHVRFNKKKAVIKAKKKARANASRMIKRAFGKKRGRVNVEKHMESMKNALNDLKREVILMKEKMDGLDCDNTNNGKGAIPWQIVYMMYDDVKNKGREFTRVYLPKIMGYIVFGTAMAALGYTWKG